jgi:predicted AlkP superfamily phosphohydrolase/phosphomutase
MQDRERVMVIGLDGVPYDLIRQWTDAGHLPNLARLMARGVSGPLASTVPPTSGPAWTSLATGKNPGKTGIYDFLYRREGSYVFPPVNTTMRSGKTLWSLLSDHERSVGVVNLPISYPVEEVNGVLVSGWMTPYYAKDFTWPREVAAELDRHVGDYRIYPAETFSESRREAFFGACDELLDMLTSANMYLMRRDDHDFFMPVYFDTDRVLHQMWHDLDPGHPWHLANGKRGEKRGKRGNTAAPVTDNRSTTAADRSAQVIRYFTRLDSDIGRLIDAFGDDARVAVISDHGMGRASRFVVLNNLLLRLGYIVLADDLATRLKAFAFRRGFTLRNVHRLADRLGLAKHAEYKNVYSFDGILKKFFLSFTNVDWQRTRAYSFGRHYGSVYLNLKGREPQGCVAPEDYDRVRDELIEAVSDYVDPELGRPIVGECMRREDVYAGERIGEAPDIILRPQDPSDIFYGLSDFGSSRIWDETYRYSGMHRPDGLLIAAGPGIRQGEHFDRASLTDIAPTVLYWMGLPVPRDMDGRPLVDIMTSQHNDAHDVRFGGDAESGGSIDRREYDAEEEEEIMDRLRDLGYMN